MNALGRILFNFFAVAIFPISPLFFPFQKVKISWQPMHVIREAQRDVTGLVAVAACAVTRCGICQKLSPNNRCSKSNQTDSPNFLADAMWSVRLRFAIGRPEQTSRSPKQKLRAATTTKGTEAKHETNPQKPPTQTDAATCCFETEPRAAGVTPVCSLANCYLPAPQHLEPSSARSARHSGR
jgi:hypothetical protein